MAIGYKDLRRCKITGRRSIGKHRVRRSISGLQTDPNRKEIFQGLAWNPLRNENQPCAPVVIGPGVQPYRIMEHVLDTMNDQRAPGAVLAEYRASN